MARRMTQFVIQLKCEDVVQKNIPLKWYPKVYLLCFLAPTTKIKLILFDNRSQFEHNCVRERHTEGTGIFVESSAYSTEDWIKKTLHTFQN